ncbi:hypothetical protein HCN51_36395 [Nonomuraea sp. FMUSA5-5]|uniref:Uncharacterized protein n=1 Tax=Nonomuraea composti TaxID=2720023 RepID=A0ABX1BBC6_9ACTN|nr:hypothetical protein [Nonomuraea sp. FMUSA5-5]NJP94856.1 hypothetical protein [Nonomuraea sp. FMUSA5-5]
MLQVRDVRTATVVGTIELTGEGELVTSSDELNRLVRQAMMHRGLSAQEAYEYYNGWSNGYVVIEPMNQSLARHISPAEQP